MYSAFVLHVGESLLAGKVLNVLGRQPLAIVEGVLVERRRGITDGFRMPPRDMDLDELVKLI